MTLHVAHPLGTGRLWFLCSAVVSLVPDARPRWFDAYIYL